MMTLGLVIEEVRYHTPLWVPKIPLAAGHAFGLQAIKDALGL